MTQTNIFEAKPLEKKDLDDLFNTIREHRHVPRGWCSGPNFTYAPCATHGARVPHYLNVGDAHWHCVSCLLKDFKWPTPNSNE